MKVVISEKQLARILGKKKEVDEILDTSATAVTSTAVSPTTPSSGASAIPTGPGTKSSATTTNDIGSSPSAEDMPPYPPVDHWESGLVRGPANQVDTKSNWTDVVGSKLSRGHANPLR